MNFVFDWDGTLMDSTPRIVAAMQGTAVDLGLPVPSDDAIRHLIGLSLEHVFDALFPQTISQSREELTAAYRHQFVVAQKVPSPLFEGVEILLEELKGAGHRLAIATGKARHGLQRVLDEVSIAGLFDDSICADEAQSKPHPEMLLTLLERNAWRSSETIMIGDTSHDLEMARQAGLKAIAVSFGAHDEEHLSQHQFVELVDSVDALRNALRALYQPAAKRPVGVNRS